jgi:hypothetical protein
MATTKDRLGRVPGISDPGLNLAGGLASLDTGLREGLREIRDELRGLNAWLEAKASTWLVGAGIAWLSLLMAGLALLMRR